MNFIKSRKIWLIGAIVLLIIGISVKLFRNREVVVDPGFSRYISAYTAGTISTESRIRIQLASETGQTVELNAPIEKKLFSFSPQLFFAKIFIK